jgi:tetratricopeptide (TPR) repeat protein
MKIDDKEIQEMSKAAYNFLKQGQPLEALDLFKQILEWDPDNNYALVGTGDAYRKLNNFSGAENYYNACLEKHPTNNFALFGLADTHKARGEYRNAISLWNKYLELDDKNVTVLTRVADAYRKLHDFVHSRETYLLALQYEGDNAYAIVGLGHLHYDFKEYRDALFYYEKMTVKPLQLIDKRILTSIGNCHRKLKQFNEGIPYFEEALALEPSNFYSLFGLGDCYRGLNNSEKSLEYWNRILASDPRNKVILTRAGDAYCTLRDYDSARDYYNRALAIEYDIYAVLGLSIIAKAEGRVEDAIKNLTNLITQDPKNYRPYLALAECFIATRQAGRAIDTLKDWTAQGIRNPRITEMLEALLANELVRTGNL